MTLTLIHIRVLIILLSIADMNNAVGNHAVKEFFTESEWDLIFHLVSHNVQFCEDDEEDPEEDYYSIANKIITLFN